MMDHVPHNEDGAAACTSTCRGGSTTRSSISRAAITSRSAAAGACRLRLHGRHLTRYSGPAAATASAEGRLPPLLRRDGRLLRARRDDPQRRLLLRDRSDVVDRWGIPVLRFHWKWTDHELKQVKHMQETFRALIHEMGGTPMSPMPTTEQGYGIARRAASSTSWAACAWAAIRRRRCSTATARRTT